MKCLLFEDPKTGMLSIIEPMSRFQQDWESEAHMILRLSQIAIPDICQFISVEIGKIPTDLTFRVAWKLGDVNKPIKIDLNTAEKIHRENLATAAFKKALDLTKECIEAKKKQNLPLQVALQKTIRILGTVHNMDLTHCKTAEDLKYAIPKELHDVWTLYDPSPSSRV